MRGLQAPEVQEALAAEGREDPADPVEDLAAAAEGREDPVDASVSGRGTGKLYCSMTN